MTGRMRGGWPLILSMSLRVLWALLLAAAVVTEVWTRTWAVAVIAAVALGFAARDVVTAPRRGRAACLAARSDLARAIRTMDREAFYLARDERVVLTRHRIGRLPIVDCVDRYPEADLLSFADERSGVVAHECFRIPMLWGRVIRRQEAVRAEVAGDDVRLTTPRQTRRQEAAGVLQMLRMLRAGHLFAGEGEMRDLATQIAAAEPITALRDRDD